MLYVVKSNFNITLIILRSSLIPQGKVLFHWGFQWVRREKEARRGEKREAKAQTNQERTAKT